MRIKMIKVRGHLKKSLSACTDQGMITIHIQSNSPANHTKGTSPLSLDRLKKGKKKGHLAMSLFHFSKSLGVIYAVASSVCSSSCLSWSKYQTPATAATTAAEPKP